MSSLGGASGSGRSGRVQSSSSFPSSFSPGEGRLGARRYASLDGASISLSAPDARASTLFLQVDSLPPLSSVLLSERRLNVIVPNSPLQEGPLEGETPDWPQPLPILHLGGPPGNGRPRSARSDRISMGLEASYRHQEEETPPSYSMGAPPPYRAPPQPSPNNHVGRAPPPYVDPALLKHREPIRRAQPPLDAIPSEAPPPPYSMGPPPPYVSQRIEREVLARQQQPPNEIHGNPLNRPHGAARSSNAMLAPPPAQAEPPLRRPPRQELVGAEVALAAAQAVVAPMAHIIQHVNPGVRAPPPPQPNARVAEPAPLPHNRAADQAHAMPPNPPIEEAHQAHLGIAQKTNQAIRTAFRHLANMWTTTFEARQERAPPVPIGRPPPPPPR